MPPRLHKKSSKVRHTVKGKKRKAGKQQKKRKAASSY